MVVLGEGEAIRNCREIMFRAGIRVLDAPEPGRAAAPIILGEIPHLFGTALELIGSGHDLMLASPAALSATQLETLFASRAPRQALFLWSESRFHPRHLLVAGLVEADAAGWGPRYIRQFTGLAEKASPPALRWRLLEIMTLLQAYAGHPSTISTTGSVSPVRGCLDLVTAAVRYGDLDAYIQL